MEDVTKITFAELLIRPLLVFIRLVVYKWQKRREFVPRPFATEIPLHLEETVVTNALMIL